MVVTHKHKHTKFKSQSVQKTEWKQTDDTTDCINFRDNAVSNYGQYGCFVPTAVCQVNQPVPSHAAFFQHFVPGEKYGTVFFRPDTIRAIQTTLTTRCINIINNRYTPHKQNNSYFPKQLALFLHFYRATVRRYASAVYAVIVSVRHRLAPNSKLRPALHLGGLVRLRAI